MVCRASPSSSPSGCRYWRNLGTCCNYSMKLHSQSLHVYSVIFHVFYIILKKVVWVAQSINQTINHSTPYQSTNQVFTLHSISPQWPLRQSECLGGRQQCEPPGAKCGAGVWDALQPLCPGQGAPFAMGRAVTPHPKH